MKNFSIRTTKTASGATAVQVVRYHGRATEIIKHLGSARTSEELSVLQRSAELFVQEHQRQLSLFHEKQSKLLHVDHARSLATTHHFARNFFLACAAACGLALKPLFLDLAIMRIIEPSSKRRTLSLLKKYFGVNYSDRVYHTFKQLLTHKAAIERTAVSCAKQVLKENLFLVLYDVTTLYFEAHRDDELRTRGFSKDNKSQQPQIIVGLVVTRSGFPLAREVFRGKTFEGHTMLPLLSNFVREHKIGRPTVVADAAMLSRDNIALLESRGISYIVGARLSNMNLARIREVSSALNRREGAIIRVSSAYGDLICSFPEKRYRKDKHILEAQVERAKALIKKSETGKRAKFVKKTKANAVSFDEDLKHKAELLLGVKGYCTNIPKRELRNKAIISAYHDLWHVEASFRMSKHDLETRPIFHCKEDAVRAHVLLCFVALILGKYLEITTALSLQKIRNLLWDVTETHIKDTLTDETFVFSSPTERIHGKFARQAHKKMENTALNVRSQDRKKGSQWVAPDTIYNRENSIS